MALKTAPHPTLNRDAHLLMQDEHEILEVYRKAKRMGYADITISVQEGSRVKLWLTEKLR